MSLYPSDQQADKTANEQTADFFCIWPSYKFWVSLANVILFRLYMQFPWKVGVNKITDFFIEQYN